MKTTENRLAEILVQKGYELFNEPYKKIDFTKNPEADELLNNLNDFPHAFVLACIMDRRIRAERAWFIPYKISQEIGSFLFSRLLELSKEQIIEMFKRKNLHFYNDVMGVNFYLGIQRIHNDYNDDASRIWKDKPPSATVLMRFLEFRGIGIKIASMAANILVREFKIPFKTKVCIDISPDVQVRRVFKRLGFISKDAKNEELTYCARELHPEYPGIFDLSCWQIGRNWCRPKNPQCHNCYLQPYCPKVI